MTGDFWIRRASKLLETRIEDDLVALDVDQGSCYGFNATAARVWDLLEQPRRFSEIHEVLLEEYQVDVDTCDRELRALLSHMKQDGLLAMQAIGK